MNSRKKINTITVSILNDQYTIKGDADVEHIEQVANYVDYKMKEFLLKNSTLPSKKLAVLTALNIADELFRLQKDYQEIIQLLDESPKKR